MAGNSGSVRCPVGPVDHVVLLTGYNKTHWFIKNSWSNGWGNNGYAYIQKANDCQLSTYIDIWQVNFPPNVFPNPTPTPPTPTPPGPSPNPSPSTSINLTIRMSDSFGDGWNGNILGLMQNNLIVGRFGESFTTGSQSGPLTISINSTV